MRAGATFWAAKMSRTALAVDAGVGVEQQAGVGDPGENRGPEMQTGVAQFGKVVEGAKRERTWGKWADGRGFGRGGIAPIAAREAMRFFGVVVF